MRFLHIHGIAPPNRSWSVERHSDVPWHPGGTTLDILNRGGFHRMLSTQMVRHVLRDEAVTRGLGDIEARMIVEWLVERAEMLGESIHVEVAWQSLKGAIRRAKVLARFIQLWGDPRSRGAALQLARSESVDWPLPSGDVDSGLFTESILAWMDRRDELSTAPAMSS